MPLSFALEDTNDPDDTEDDRLLYDLLLPASPRDDAATYEGSAAYLALTVDGDDEDDALALELELGLDQYDVLQHLLRDAEESCSFGVDAALSVNELTPNPNGSNGAEAEDGAMVDDNNVGMDGACLDFSETAAENQNVESLAESAATTRRRRPRAAATKRQRATNQQSGTTAAAAKADKKKLLTYNSNKARDERREELLYLRRKVTELEARLADVRRASQSHASSPEDDSRLANTKSRAKRREAVCRDAVAVKNMGVWQEIASRQYVHRMKAERENIRIKLVLESQLKIARSLEKLLKKTASAKEVERCIGKAQQRVHFVRPPSASHDCADAALFEQLLAGVEQSYREVDTVFEATGLARMESSRIDARVQQQQQQQECGSRDENDQIELQVFGSKVMPFDMHATGLAVWNHYVFAKERIPNRSYCHNSPQTMVSATADTILENFSVQVDVNSTSVLFCLKLVLRRYIEAERIVVVWRAFFDPTQVSNEPLAGVRFLEKGYVVVKKHQPTSTRAAALDGASDNDDDSAPPHNLLQTCFISTPVSIGDLVHADPSKVGALTDLVLSATAANIASSHQMIENVLLEQAAVKRSSV